MIDIEIGLTRGDFSLDVAFTAGEGATALFGRSGSGKSTILAAIAGLLRPARGHIRIGGATLFDAAHRIALPSHKRRIGYVFQDAQLFPHLSVRANLGYGRFFAPKAERRLELDAVADVLGIGALLDRRPDTLSGGERQRVAIGRALLAAPRLLLMDEPLASLDQPRKREILPLIERVRDEFGVPILYVSHAPDEVARIAAHVVVIEAGRVVRVGTPALTLSATDATPSDSRFDAVSVLSGVIAAHDRPYAITVLDHPAGAIALPGLFGEPGQRQRIIVRGSDVSLALSAPEALSIRTALAGTVERIVTDAGPVARVELALTGGEALSAYVTRKAVDSLALAPGMAVRALVKSASIAK
jgi:molybdate transport system ATP-binding protein